jgi:hypothetical protein
MLSRARCRVPRWRFYEHVLTSGRRIFYHVDAGQQKYAHRESRGQPQGQQHNDYVLGHGLPFDLALVRVGRVFISLATAAARASAGGWSVGSAAGA